MPRTVPEDGRYRQTANDAGRHLRRRGVRRHRLERDTARGDRPTALSVPLNVTPWIIQNVVVDDGRLVDDDSCAVISPSPSRS